VAKFVVIVEVLIAEREAENPLPDKRGDRVLDQLRSARIAKTSR
jgi:hypothetical protein